MKLQLFNDSGIPFPLSKGDSAKSIFPYHSGTLEKNVDILDHDSAMISVELTDFELQGLEEGADQTFWVIVTKENQLFTFEFKKLLTVSYKNGRKAIDL